MAFSFGPGPLGLFVVIVLLTTVGGRLLGMRLRWWRALLAGFPGLVAGIIFVWAQEGRPPRPRTLPVPAVLFASLVATMVIAVLLELLARPGQFAGTQVRFAARRVPHPLRSLGIRAGRARRYFEVTRIAGRHGLASYLGARQRAGTGDDAESGAEREVAGVAAVAGASCPPRARPLAGNLRAALEEGGGIFVKLGQMLSTRSDLLPADVIAELSGLQDDVRPAAAGEIEALLAAELGAPPGTVFASFDPEPLAAASIAQVHRARLSSGELVVVKVQRPGIRALVERDLDIMRRLARTLEARAWAREYRVADLADGFAVALAEELDFRIEARNITAVAGTITIRSRVCMRACRPAGCWSWSGWTG